MTHSSHNHALLHCALDQKFIENGANLNNRDDYVVILPSSITQGFARFMDTIQSRGTRILQALRATNMYQRHRAEKYGNRAFAIQLFVQKFHHDMFVNNYQATIGINELYAIAELTYCPPFTSEGDIATAAAARQVCATLNLPHYSRRGVGQFMAEPRIVLPRKKINVIPT